MRKAEGEADGHADAMHGQGRELAPSVSPQECVGERALGYIVRDVSTTP